MTNPIYPPIHPNGPDPLDEETLALTLQGGDFPINIPLLEIIAITIIERHHLAQWHDQLKTQWGDDIVGICTKQHQYDAWRDFGKTLPTWWQAASTDPNFIIYRRVARRALRGVLTIAPAIYYFDKDNDKKRPRPTDAYPVPNHDPNLVPLFYFRGFYFYRYTLPSWSWETESWQVANRELLSLGRHQPPTDKIPSSV